VGNKHHVAAYRARNKAAGLCRNCGEALDRPGVYTRCKECRYVANQSTMAIRKANREKGLCYCGAEREDEGFSRCERCRKLGRESKKRRKTRTPYERKPQPLTGSDETGLT